MVHLAVHVMMVILVMVPLVKMLTSVLLCSITVTLMLAVQILMVHLNANVILDFLVMVLSAPILMNALLVSTHATLTLLAPI